ncbi:MAG: hypothetical protein K2X27_21520 [Candidatus Obscuribacterales bacterium]|nr:hypothetical protein [Candidatus Obscuribacterales bacterium]
MSDTETAQQQRVTRSNFATRMLTKELNTRKKTSQEGKISPADAAKFAVVSEAVEEKQTAAIS